MDELGKEDALNVCADDLQEMDDLSDINELYVCTNFIQDKNTVRIMVGRPNYNSRDMESATIVISVSILLNPDKYEGPPRYYSVASGQEAVKVRDIYVTNLDRVQCVGKYTKVIKNSLEFLKNYLKVSNVLATALYESCDLDCDRSCVGGCTKVQDNTACNECAETSFYYTDARFACVAQCFPGNSS